MSNTTHTAAALPALSSEVAARAVAAGEKAVFDGLMAYAEDGDDSDLEVGESDESHAYPTANGIEVGVYAVFDGLYLCVTVKLGQDCKVTDDGVDKALEENAAEAAADAYTYAAETGFRSAME